LIYLFEDFQLDTDRRELRRGSVLISIEPQVFDLLKFLIDNRDRVVSKDDLIGSVWGGRIVSDSTVDNRINAVRRAVADSGKDQRLIRTTIGKGVRFVGTGCVEEAPDHVMVNASFSERATIESSTAKPTPRLSIVVLPFANLSNDPAQQYFVDAVTDDLTSDLSRIVNSFVIARTTAFTYRDKPIDVKQIGRQLGVHYVLEGSVWRADEQVQVNVQLIDTDSGAHVWSYRFGTDRANLNRARDEITVRLALALKLELFEDVGRRIERDKPVNLDAQDLIMRGWAYYYRPQSAENLRLAQEAFEQALGDDPESVDARDGIATVLGELLATGKSTSRERDKARAEKLLVEALGRDRNNAAAHTQLGRLRRIQGRLIESQIELEKARSLDRNSASAMIQSGITLLFLAKPREALPIFEKYLRINPLWQNIFFIYYWIGHTHLLLNQFAAAMAALKKRICRGPKSRGCALYADGGISASWRHRRSQGHLGRISEIAA
jgi:TolB-like protein/Tfp pilus assembly protein PilF